MLTHGYALQISPDRGVNLWGASPLYENGKLLGGQYTKCNQTIEVLDEGNCGEATNRGEEACECAGQAND